MLPTIAQGLVGMVVALIAWGAPFQDQATLCGTDERAPEVLRRQLEPIRDSATPALLALARSAEWSEAGCGIAGLAALGDASAVPFIVSALKNPAWRDTAYQVARWAADYTFLLAIPAIVGAIVYESGAVREAATSGMAGVFAVGWIAAFLSGIAAIGIVLRLVDRHRFRWLGFYCLLAAGLFGAWLAVRAG